MNKTQQVEALIKIIRRSFQDLGALGTALHADVSVNASMRAVLERLDEVGEETVPQMARAKNVSRQHIQTIVDALKDAKLVELKQNPAHKRSPLVKMTRKGKEIFFAMQGREGPILKSWARDLDADDVAITLETLKRLRELVKREADRFDNTSATE